MTDCSSIQGSTTSSSSDVTTLTTASPWNSISPSSRIRVIRLVRPNPRCVLVTPNSNPSFGFSIRGGKEFGTGFFVSNVERYGEANQKGLKIGDQVVRVNGYRVEDAVHKELVQYISSQDRLTLKVRGIGMLPLKEKDVDPLTWRAVRSADSLSSSLPSTEDPFKAIVSAKRNHHKTHSTTKDKRVVLHVAPRTKLGLGICKGPEWKPGIFVQFTKNKSVAREAGLRPGDQILCVNSIDFSDVLFSEAVAVMKSSNQLEMVVRTAAGCDLFLGESSGYNSSASSVTGDQSPCWADVSAKRLTVVREEPLLALNCNSENLYADVKRYSLPSSDSGTLKQLNKTIIKLTESGTSINNTFIEDPRMTMVEGAKINAAGRSEKPTVIKQQNDLKPIPPPPPPAQFCSSDSFYPEESGVASDRQASVAHQSEAKTVIVEVHRASDAGNKQPSPPSDARPMGKSLSEPDSGTLKRDFNESGGGGSLCSAIAEELKKRKEKQRDAAGQVNPNRNHNHIYSNSSPNGCSNQMGHAENPLTRVSRLHKKLGGAANGSDRSGGDQHSALMDEFKRAHQRMFKNGFQENDHKERQDALRKTVVMDNKDNEHVEEETNKEKFTSSYQNIDLKSQQPKYALMDKFPGQRKFTQLNPRLDPQPAPSSPTPDYETVQIRRLSQSEQRYQDLASDINGAAHNRRTARPGTVSIGEFSPNARKEPVKFDFLVQKNHKTEKIYSNVDETSLRSELQDTLSRSNLRRTSTTFPTPSSNVRIEQLEHQSHCQLLHQNLNPNGSHNSKEYTNVEKLTRMLQGKQDDDDAASSRSTGSLASRQQTNGGILKNGNSRRGSRSSFTKNAEKSITFGN